MRTLLVAVLAVALFATPCLATDRSETIYCGAKSTYYPAEPGPVFDGGRDILYDNGPFETGGGLSVLQSVTLGMGTYGFGHQTYYDYWITDDFFIPVGETWEIAEITFFAYQTGSPTSPSTITGVYLMIYDGPPDDLMSNIIWGGAATNVLSATMWSGVYRVLESDQTATNRPIMANTCSVGATLGAGEYWLVWQSDGSLSSGPWAPPITILGQVGTGNAMQSIAGVWAPVIDLQQQGFPFIIEGTFPSPVEQSTWTAVKAMFNE